MEWMGLKVIVSMLKPLPSTILAKKASQRWKNSKVVG